MNVINIIFIEIIEREIQDIKISRKEICRTQKRFRDDKNAYTYNFLQVSPRLLINNEIKTIPSTVMS